MIRKGINFRKSTTIRGTFPTKEERETLIATGLLPETAKEIGYVVPFQVIPGGLMKAMKVTGYSRTNMPYVIFRGVERVLWFEDGQAFLGTKPGPLKPLRNWIVRGTQKGKAVEREIEATDHNDAVLRASKGKDFILVTSCVLKG